MKKSYAFLVAFIAFFVIVAITEKPFNENEAQRQIEKYKPSEQERVEFQHLLNDNTYYYYNNLDDVQKEAYVTMYTSFMNFDESFIVEVTYDQLQEVFTAVLYDNPHIFWVSNDYQYIENENSISVTPNYRLTTNEAQTITEQVNDIVDEVSASANELSTEYDKELYIHNYVCENTVYDESTFNAEGDTVYSALVNGKAICEGYSRAIQILLDAVDIDNYLVIGDGTTDGKTEPHMWNIVEIDGENYHLDVTWDDSFTETKYGYLYFNVNDQIISRDHISIKPRYNSCVSLNANYFVMNNLYVDEFNNFDELVSPVSQALKNFDNTVGILFSNEPQFKKAMKYFEDENYAFFDFVSDSVSLSEKNLQKNEIEYYTIDESFYLCLIFKED